MRIFYYTLAFTFAFFINPLFSQLSPEDAVAQMGRGINLGNTLEPPTEGAWNNGPAQESYFDAYLEAGFTNIRIPVRWDQHTGNSAPFAIDESWMTRVEEVVDWGLSRGFLITLNGHHEDWLKNNYSNETLRARYDSIWVQVADRFQDRSDSLIFEIINEPNGMTVAQVDDLNERILGIIRKTNPTRNVIYSGNMYSNTQQLFDAAILDDDYIIAYYHAYDPWNFSGQGNGTWGTANDYQQMTNKYQSVKNWSTQNNIPVHHSEFGAVVRADFNSRMRIYAHNVENCMVNGFAFSVWDDGGDFRVLQRQSNSWPEVKDILVHYGAESPAAIFSTFVQDENTEEATIVVDWVNRTTGNSEIIMERSVGGSSDFVEIATLPADATTYTDLDVEEGKTYTYRMYTYSSEDVLLHGYPTRISISSTVQSPFNGTAIEIPGDVEVEDYDLGGEGLAYHDTDPANIPNAYRMDEGVDIGALGGGYNLAYVENGEWIEYTINVSQSGTYSVGAIVASEIGNGTFKISFDKNDASTTFTSPNTAGWNNYQPITAESTITLEEGVQQMRLDITNGNAFNLNKLTFNLESSTSTSDEDGLDEGVTISPNPTQNFVHIELSNKYKEHSAYIELFNVAGARVAIFEMQSRYMSLDISNYENGIYLLKVKSKELDFSQRLVKH